jgi:hypothetical protein
MCRYIIIKMSVLTFPAVPFKFEQLINLYDNLPYGQHGKKEITEEIIAYLNHYFYLASNGTHYFYNQSRDEFIPYDKQTISSIYINRFPKELKHWFTVTNYRLYTVIMSIDKPRLTSTEINLFKGFKYVDKSYESFDERTKKHVNLFLSYVFEVLASSNIDSYNYIMNWTANMCQGNKNDSCLYFKGPEGIGKSTFSNMLQDHVLGRLLAVTSGTEPLKGQYNKILLGKLLVILEDLQTFSATEWSGVTSQLKRMITEDTLDYRDLYEKRFTADNTANFIITANFDPIQASEGRRYFIADISTHRMSDHAYFGNLKKKCDNDRVGEALFNYFREMDVSSFIPQQMPITQSKINAITDRLDSVYKYLKDRYVLKNISLDIELKKLYCDYVVYMSDDKKKPKTKNEFIEKLKNIKIYTSKGSQNKTVIKCTHTELYEMYTSRKWILDHDDHDINSSPEESSSCELY